MSMCEYCRDNDIPLYVTLAKPVGTARDQASWVCTKRDVDRLKVLEENYNVFTHMTPLTARPAVALQLRESTRLTMMGKLFPAPTWIYPLVML